jgi:hypothetical protein
VHVHANCTSQLRHARRLPLPDRAALQTATTLRYTVASPERRPDYLSCGEGHGVWLGSCSGLPDPRQVETGCLLPSLQSPLSSTRRTSAKRTRLFGRTRAATLGHHKRLPWEHYTAPTIQHSSTRGGDNANALSPTRTIQTRRPPPQEPKKPKAEKRASRPFRGAVARCSSLQLCCFCF